MQRYFYINKNDDLSETSYRAIYADETRCVIEYNEGEILSAWTESTLEEMEQDFGFNPFEPQPEQPKPDTKQVEIEALQKENKLLKAQVGALAEQQEFIEDCLIEIGQVVYA